MAAKMAAEILDLMYLSSAFRYNDEWSVDFIWNKNVEIKYVENNNSSCIFSNMAAKMAAENLNLMYLSSAFRYKNEWIVDSYEIKDVEIKYVENNNNSCIFSKMAARMAAENLNLMYLSLLSDIKTKWSVDSYKIKHAEIKYVENNNNSCIFSKMAAKMAAENFKQMYLSSSGIHKNKWMCPVMLCERHSVSNYVEIHNKN